MATERFSIECNKKDFLAMKTMMKDYDPRIEYPGYLDPSYWIFADIPMHMVETVRNQILAIKEQFRKEA